MPNRVIKESIWTSPNMNQLSAEGERHFYRCLMTTDDFGCFQATPLVLKGKCYPIMKKVNEKDIEKWNEELEYADLVRFWDDDCRKYGIFINFSKHQRVRSTHQRKTPPPPDDICQRVPANDGLNPNPNPNPNPNKKTMRDSDESLVSLRRWFEEIMWPSVRKKTGKDLTWEAIKKQKPDEDTRARIVEYFKSYPSIAATYPPGEFFAPMQDPVRVIKNKRYLDVLEPYRDQQAGTNGSPRRKVYITRESYEAALKRGETNISLRLPEESNV